MNRSLGRYLAAFLVIGFFVAGSLPAFASDSDPSGPLSDNDPQSQVNNTALWFVTAFNGSDPEDYHTEVFQGVAVDGLGHVYITDASNQRVTKLGTDGQFLATWGQPGNGPGQFNSPAGIVVD